MVITKYQRGWTGNKPSRENISSWDSRREVPLGVQLELVKVFLVWGNVVGTL